MTLAELLARTPQSVETNLCDFLSSRNLLHEVNGLSFAGDVESPRVRVDILFHHSFDGNRIWELAVVRLDGEPVMLTQRAGRSGQDLEKEASPKLHRQTTRCVDPARQEDHSTQLVNLHHAK